MNYKLDIALYRKMHISTFLNNNKKMVEKKAVHFKTPDLATLQEVIINGKTRIYIAVGADPEEARSRYLSRVEAKTKSLIANRKVVES